MQLHKLYLHFYDQPRLWHHSETIIYQFNEEQNDAFSLTNTVSYKNLRYN